MVISIDSTIMHSSSVSTFTIDETIKTRAIEYLNEIDRQPCVLHPIKFRGDERGKFLEWFVSYALFHPYSFLIVCHFDRHDWNWLRERLNEEERQRLQNSHIDQDIVPYLIKYPANSILPTLIFHWIGSMLRRLHKKELMVSDVESKLKITNFFYLATRSLDEEKAWEKIQDDAIRSLDKEIHNAIEIYHEYVEGFSSTLKAKLHEVRSKPLSAKL